MQITSNSCVMGLICPYLSMLNGPVDTGSICEAYIYMWKTYLL